MLSKISLDQADAARLAAVCIDTALRQGVAISLAIVDDAGALLHFVRMDGVRAHTVELASRKARAAASAGVTTRLIDMAVKAGMVTTVDSVGWGGAPITVSSGCAGAIGISGSTPEIDDEIASIAAGQSAAPAT